MDEAYAPKPCVAPTTPHLPNCWQAPSLQQPHAGESVLPDAEAWAGCRRDLELGPARQLHCYLYVRGEPGDTLDGLAVVGLGPGPGLDPLWPSQPLEPESLPFVNHHERG